ncbi:MAG: phage tail protein, partial [Streptococcus sp.]|nr:phage tail protein [Streptococcus sp.]
MIYLTEGNIPLNAAYDDNITQEANSTYQLTFKFPTNNILWQRLREETFLTADDLHSEQDFVIFEVEKKLGYIQVYANQVMTLLNHYVVNPINLDRTTGSTALSQFAGSITRENPFSFFSDIEDRHTFNTDTTNAMEALTKDKHSILGQWGGDLVRHSYQVRLLKNGGSENESLFMYKKNLSSYQHKTSTKSLKTRITFIATVKGEGEKAPDRKLSVAVDSPLINKYSQIYEDVVEVNDQDVKDEASLREYGKQYFRTTLCDMLEDSIEIDVVGQSDVPVQMFDVVGVHHEFYGLDVRKKITKYTYSPMAKKLKSIGFGQFQSGLASAIGNVVSDAFKSENQHFQSNFERQLARELKNADLAFERKKEELTNQFTDEVNAIKAKSEENKRALSDEINRKFHDFSPEGFDEAKNKAEEALKKAGTSAELVEQVKGLVDTTSENFDTFKAQAFSNFALNSEVDYKLSTAQKNNDLKFADYKQDTEGRFASIASQMTGKANQTDFQRVKETAQLYERILGSSESDISKNASRLVMSSEIFQTEVGKYVTDDNNLIVNSLTMSTNTLVNASRQGVEVFVNDGVFTIKAQGLTSYNFSGFTLPIYVKKIYHGETYTLGFKYRIREYPDSTFVFNVKNHGLNKSFLSSDIDKDRPPLNEWQEFQKTFTVQEDFAFGEDKNYPFYIFLAKNGWIEFKEPILVRGSKTGPYKPSQFDDAYKITDEAKGLATDAQTRAIQVSQGLEATRTQVTQLAGSYAIQNLNSAGDIINGINLGANGNNRIIGKATHITGDTLIDNAVIKSAMIDKLKTANFEAGSVTTTILGAEAVTAEKVKFDTAFIQKLVSQQAFIDELFAKQATINRIQSIDFTGNNIKGGKISSLNGVTDFDLQTGWIEMNRDGVGIVNHFVGRPIQYLVF